MKRLFLTVLAISAAAATHAAALPPFRFSTTGLNDLAHGQAAIWGLQNDATSNSRYKNLLTALSTPGAYISSASLTLFNPSDWKAEPRDVLYVNILHGLDIKNGVQKYTYDSNPRNTDTSWGTNVFVDSPSTRNDKNDKAQQNLQFYDAQPGSLLRAPDSSMPLAEPKYWDSKARKWVYTNEDFDAGDRAAMPGTWTDTKGDKNGKYGYGTDTDDVVIPFSAPNLAMLERYLKWDFEENKDGKDNWGVGLGFAAECHYYFTSVCLDIVIDFKSVPPPPPAVPDSGSTLVLAGVALVGMAAFRRRLAF